MQIKAIKTHPIRPYESLTEILDRYVHPQEEEIIAITSKIVSLCEGRIALKKDYPDKMTLIKQEADAYLEPEIQHGVCLTLKNELLIASAGIDESNVENAYVLYPSDIPGSAKKIWEFLREKSGIKKLGVIITDSRSTISRKGVIGFGLGWCGFKPLYSYVGQEDCFGRMLRFTQANHLDALSAAAVHVMGEGAECTPIASITNLKKIEFQERAPTLDEISAIHIPPKDDLYSAIYKNPGWVWKNNI